MAKSKVYQVYVRVDFGGAYLPTAIFFSKKEAKTYCKSVYGTDKSAYKIKRVR